MLERVVGESGIDRIDGEGRAGGSGGGGGLSKENTGDGPAVCGDRATLINRVKEQDNVTSAARFWVVPPKTSTDQDQRGEQTPAC